MLSDLNDVVYNITFKLTQMRVKNHPSLGDLHDAAYLDLILKLRYGVEHPVLG